jgi:peptide/nickel transport system ATP-binding protein
VTREVGPVGDSEVMGSASGTATGYATERFLEVRNLTVAFPSEDGVVHAVNDLSFGLDQGRTLAIVGESGSGKSVTSQAIMGLHKGGRARVLGEVWFDGQELVSLSDEEMRPLRGEKMAMIFQDPLSSLHPYYKVGAQIAEAYRTHNKVSKAVAKKRSIDMLERVGVPNPDKRFDQYPHEFSGGMRQRAMIAMALVCDPKLLIADEPTTALDVTVQAQILELMKDLQREFNSAIILITHDLGVVAEMADDVVVMYGGRCVEHASVETTFAGPQMPYTWGLLGSMPRLDRDRQERLEPIAGSPPSLVNLPSGCVFHPRCRYKKYVEGNACYDERPELLEAELGHSVRCHIAPPVRRQVFVEQIKPLL